jgi:hypothetical protein
VIVVFVWWANVFYQDANYTVLTGEDFIIHDTISFDNTTPVAERIHRMRKVCYPNLCHMLHARTRTRHKF